MGTEIQTDVMHKRILLTHEGWGFVFDTIGGVKYYRAVSPQGWVTVIDFQGVTEDWAIEKAWKLYCALSSSVSLMDAWLKAHPNKAGIVYDDEKAAYVATLVLKSKPPQEADGATPQEAVLNWKLAHGK